MKCGGHSSLHMTRDTLLGLLHGLRQVTTREDDVVCHQCLEPYADEDTPRCADNCELAKAITWLEDNGNERQYVEITGTDSAPAPRGWLVRK
jgi:hypothetical protein